MKVASNCYYHEERPAVHHCRYCGRSICEECTIKHKSQYRYKTYFKARICPICEYNSIIRANDEGVYNYYRYLVPGIGIGIFVFIFILLGFLSSWWAGLLILILTSPFSAAAIYCFVYVFKLRPKKYEQAKANRAKFVKEMGLDDRFNKLSETNNNQFYDKIAVTNKNSFYCIQCGTLLKKGDKTCYNCGDPTDDEIALIK